MRSWSCAVFVLASVWSRCDGLSLSKSPGGNEALQFARNNVIGPLGRRFETMSVSEEEGTFVSGSQICFGRGQCFDPNGVSKTSDTNLQGSTRWQNYVHPSAHFKEDDGAPYSKCCSSCSTTASCSNSRGEEHIFLSHIWPFFKETPHDPTFLEVGGNDGVQASNTIFLERCMGWKGVMIEPHPRNFKVMMSSRPGVVGIQSALCETNQHVRFSGKPSVKGHLLDRQDLVIPCGPVSDYLRMLNVSNIHFFSLDVEGAELYALNSISWSELQIGVMVIEENKSEPEKNTAAREILSSKGGMELILTHCWGKESCDSYFARPSFVDVEAVKANLEKNPVFQGKTATLSASAKKKCTGNGK